MLYGRIVYTPNPRTASETQYINVGDVFQTLAWDLVFEQCGITRAQTVDIDRFSLRTYDDEDVLLPMNGWFGTGKGAEIFPMSPHIHPLYIGYHNIHEKDAALLPPGAVIGCRDEKTLDCVAPHVHSAFISGCMTILFPPRSTAPKDGKTFIVDVSAKVRKAIPPQIRQNAQLLSHEVRFVPQGSDGFQAEIRRIEDTARGFIKRYRDEAKLVITSRLHCAMVCLAIGVPVVLMRESFDERYAFVDRFLPLYDAGEFDGIDWSPKAPDVTEIREWSMRMACAALMGTPDIQAQAHVHAFYQNRIRHEIATPFMVRAYDKVRDFSPALADFIREKVLFRFTIAGAREEEKAP